MPRESEGQIMKRTLSDRAHDSHVRRMEVYGLRLAGHSLVQIGEALSITPQWAATLLKDAMKSIERETISQIRDMELDRLDAALRATVMVLNEASRMVPARHPVTGAVLYGAEGEVLMRPADSGQILGAVDRIVKLSESRRKLVGADAVVKDLAPEVDAAEEELMAVIRDYRRANKEEDLGAETDF